MDPLDYAGRKLFVDDAMGRAQAKLTALKPHATERVLFLAARAGYALAKEEDGIRSNQGIEAQTDYCARLAAKRFPLPPKRVPREEPDPHGYMRWRWFETGLQYQWAGSRGWTSVAPSDMWPPTPERIDLWHSLKHEPYKEVPDDGGDL
jgi:hypothetical protein